MQKGKLFGNTEVVLFCNIGILAYIHILSACQMHLRSFLLNFPVSKCYITWPDFKGSTCTFKATRRKNSAIKSSPFPKRSRHIESEWIVKDENHGAKFGRDICSPAVSFDLVAGNIVEHLQHDRWQTVGGGEGGVCPPRGSLCSERGQGRRECASDRKWSSDSERKRIVHRSKW